MIGLIILNIFGVGKAADSIIIGQPEYYKEAGITFHSSSIDTWKDYLRYRLAENFTPALPDTFGKIDFQFNKLFSGAAAKKAKMEKNYQ